MSVYKPTCTERQHQADSNRPVPDDHKINVLVNAVDDFRDESPCRKVMVKSGERGDVFPEDVSGQDFHKSANMSVIHDRQL
jgi:hypothetical protein